MASREKKTVGRKQPTTTATPSLQVKEEPECSSKPSEQPAEEKVRKSPGRKKEPAKLTLTSRAKVKVVGKTLLEKGKCSGTVKKSVLKNGVANASVIRRRALGLRERIPLKKADETVSAKRRKTQKEVVVDTAVEYIPPAVNRKRMKKRKITSTPAVLVPNEEPEDGPLLSDDAKAEERPVRTAKKAKMLDSDAEARKKAKCDSEFSRLQKIKNWASSVVQGLDLNVVNQPTKTAPAKCSRMRRHSVGKFPMARHEVKVCDNSPFIRILRPTRSVGRPRASSTRSASTKRSLRNGKTCFVQQFPLFDGLDSEYKMRRRLASDFHSGGYESDSSLSSSLHEATETDKEKEMLIKKELLETLENNPPDTVEEKQIAKEFSAAIKRSLSFDQEEGGMDVDTNSNEVASKTSDAAILPDSESENVEKRKTRSSMKKIAEANLTAEEEEVETHIQCAPDVHPDADAAEEDINDAANSVEESEFVDIATISEKTAAKPPNSTPSTSPHVMEPASTMDESPESLAEKSQILKALGLQTLQEAEEARKRQGPKSDSYTGTLKTVIKLSRPTERDKKKAKERNPIKMTLQKKGRSSLGKDDGQPEEEEEYKVMKDGTSSWKSHGNQSSDTAGAPRKSHYPNRSNMDGSSDHTSDGDTNPLEEVGTTGKLLVIPEKASSFSIHPGRLCKDECTYCFGKFGLFDTPCHIAQLKTVERQDKILANEKHLTRDSCLCDACYRHVDRKANMPQYANSKSMKPSTNSSSKKQCSVIGCKSDAPNWLKRKWIMKMRRVLSPVINLDLSQPGQLSLPICPDHYADVEHLMVCAMCKRRLSRNHIHYLGPEAHDIQTVLNKMRIPVQLKEKPVVCKICRVYSTYLLKNGDEFNDDARNFYIDLKKRWLQIHNLEPMDDDEISASIAHVFQQDAQKMDANAKKRKRLTRNQLSSEPPVLEPEVDIANDETSDSRPNSPADYMVDYRNLIPNVAIECINNDGELPTRNKSLSIRRISKEEAQEKKRLRSDTAVQRLGSNPSISIRQMFPGEEDVPLNGYIEFNNAKERTPEGWEKCTSTIQYDTETKLLWHELQKPYGNQSSFLRHLILLEKYFRNGDLVLSPRASANSVNYTDSVQNRLRAYDNISCTAGPVQPLTMLPFNNPRLPVNDKSEEKSIEKSQTSIIPVAMSTPNANAQLPKKSPNLVVGLAKPSQTTNPSAMPQLVTPGGVLISTPVASKGKPPPLISLQPANKIATNSVPANTAAGNPIPGLPPKPQSQKIKFPITKNWRPKLIPIDPSVKPEKKPGLVQVISGGKPYHITLEDYKKMCAIKRTYDLRQKRLQETLKNQSNPNSLLKTTAVLKRIASIGKSSSSTSYQDENGASDGQVNNTVDASPVNPAVETKMQLNLPRIPKSLTVIPQTVTISKFNSTKTASRPISPQNHSKAKS